MFFRTLSFPSDATARRPCEALCVQRPISLVTGKSNYWSSIAGQNSCIVTVKLLQTPGVTFDPRPSREGR